MRQAIAAVQPTLISYHTLSRQSQDGGTEALALMLVRGSRSRAETGVQYQSLFGVWNGNSGPDGRKSWAVWRMGERYGLEINLSRARGLEGDCKGFGVDAGELVNRKREDGEHPKGCCCRGCLQTAGIKCLIRIWIRSWLHLHGHRRCLYA